MEDIVKSTRSRRPRMNFSLLQLNAMELVFDQTQYPDVKVLSSMSVKLNIPVEKICTWFQNRRSKFRKSSKKGHISWMRKQMFQSVEVKGRGHSHVLLNEPTSGLQVNQVPSTRINHLPSQNGGCNTWSGMALADTPTGGNQQAYSLQSGSSPNYLRSIQLATSSRNGLPPSSCMPQSNVSPSNSMPPNSISPPSNCMSQNHVSPSNCIQPQLSSPSNCPLTAHTTPPKYSFSSHVSPSTQALLSCSTSPITETPAAVQLPLSSPPTHGHSSPDLSQTGLQKSPYVSSPSSPYAPSTRTHQPPSTSCSLMLTAAQGLFAYGDLPASESCQYSSSRGRRYTRGFSPYPSPVHSSTHGYPGYLPNLDNFLYQPLCSPDILPQTSQAVLE